MDGPHNEAALQVLGDRFTFEDHQTRMSPPGELVVRVIANFR